MASHIEEAITIEEYANMIMTATVSNGLYTLSTPELGELVFGSPPPEEYCWSGYTDQTEEDFIKNNFGDCCVQGRTYFTCSNEYAVGLIEYLVLYIINEEELDELMDYLFNGMAYFFLIGYEARCAAYDDLPDWCRELLDLYVADKTINRVSFFAEDEEFDIFIFDKIDLQKYSTEKTKRLLARALATYEQENSDSNSDSIGDD